MAEVTTGVLGTPAPPGRRRGEAAAADLAAQLAALGDLSRAELQATWRRLHRSLPPPRLSRELLQLGIAYRLQEQALGGLRPAQQRRLLAMADGMASQGDLAKPRAVSPKPGGRLIRVWQGITHTVLVLEDGFAWQGQTWPSLSSIARAITGTAWSGPRFFGLVKPASSQDEVKGDPPSAAAATRMPAVPSDPAAEPADG